MQRYIVIRLFHAVLALIGVSIVVFTLVRVAGSPLDALLPFNATEEDRARVEVLWGFDRPLHEQYLRFVWNALRLDFGDSIKFQGQTAMDLIGQALPASLQLAGFALLFSVLMAVPVGVVSAVKKGTLIDMVGKTVALLGQSLPPFWLGIVLIWIFSVNLGWLPVSGRGGFTHVILPGVALGWFSVAAFMRLTRSAMLNVLDSEYVKFARIKGTPEWKVVWKHALKNAAIPPLTLFGIVAGIMVTGVVTLETVFAWPGIGQLALTAVLARDYAVVQGLVLLISAIFITINLVVDVLYAYLDPRVRYDGARG
ncbi:MAG: ABC transporter permease [Chloroflexota bacterium]|nr:ABC transporter permease [Chloroflexota bacterium]MDE2883623.1 ABC transporter permease [Chloroflexota bacterium]